MRRRKLFVFFAIGISSVGLNAEPLVNVQSDQEQNTSIVNIWINGVDYGTETVAFERSGKKFIECQALTDIGILVEKFDKDTKKNKFCSLSSSSIQFTEDSSLQSLNITVPAEFFAKANNEFIFNPPQRADLGSFLNYSLLYSRDEVEDEFNTFAEWGVFKDFWLLKNSMLYRSNPTVNEKEILRVATVFDLEFPDNFLRLTLGDTTTPGNSLNNSFRFGGLSFGTNYTSRPDFVYWNTPTLSGSAAVPSTVDLYLNGVSLYRENVAPGSYSLPTGSLLNKAGNAQIVVEDVLGNRTVRSFPIYINSLLLKPKLDEYNISLGKLRYDYDEADDDYREFFTKLYYRRGISNYTTLGTDLLYSEEVSNAGLLWTQAIKNYVLLDTVISGSQTDEEQGYAGSISLSREFLNWSMGVQSQRYSENYKYLELDDVISYKKSTNLVYLTASNLGFIDSFGINYIEQTYYKNDEFGFDDGKVLNVSAGKRLTQKMDFSVGYFKDFGDDKDSGFSFALNYDWGENRKMNLDHYTDDQSTRLSYSKYTPTQEGFDYTVGVNHQDDEVNFNGYGLWKTSVGDLGVSHDEYTNRRITQVNFDGALVWLGGKTAFTKFVDNSFGLVEVKNHPNLDIYRSSSLIGQTNNQGYMFVHNIIPYIQYDIAFDHDQLDMDETFDHSTQKIVGLEQRGYKVDFPIYKTKRIPVRLKDVNNNLLLRGSQAIIEGKNDEPYFIDSKGMVNFYVTQPATYKLIVNLQGGAVCQAEVPVSQNQFQNPERDILDVVCK